VVQDVLTTLVRELPHFVPNRRPGAFRSWLKAMTVHRLRASWQANRAGTRGAGGDALLEQFRQLEDPTSPLSRAWDDEHDRHVASALLVAIRLEFSAATWLAFERTSREGRPVAEVAAELGMTPNAVMIAKSRVLKRLRERAGGLLD
jgi:RNA polymerase sigma-70 factor (ECF subfamily)